jgi:HlyD family secretion protein
VILRRLVLWLSLVGLLIAIAGVVYDSRPVSAPSLAPTLPPPPFADYLVGSGVVEASSGNIVIGTPVAGVIRHIDVQVGDRVEAGAPLFEIDARDLQAQLITARARLQQAEAALRKPQHQLANAEQLHRRDAAAINLQDLSNRRDEYALAAADVALARAQLQQLEMEVERYTIRAPITGTVLQMKMRSGEFMEAASSAIPAMILGSERPLNVRVDIDENVASRFTPNAPAVAYPRGTAQQRIVLRFAYLEPLIVAKSTLTGLPTERTDRRILQLVYRVESNDVPIYVGQQLDVYVETPAPRHSGSAP